MVEVVWDDGPTLGLAAALLLETVCNKMQNKCCNVGWGREENNPWALFFECVSINLGVLAKFKCCCLHLPCLQLPLYFLR